MARFLISYHFASNRMKTICGIQIRFNYIIDSAVS